MCVCVKSGNEFPKEIEFRIQKPCSLQIEVFHEADISQKIDILSKLWILSFGLKIFPRKLDLIFIDFNSLYA